MDTEMREIGRMTCGPMTLLWFSFYDHTMFSMVPSAMADEIPPHRPYLDPDSPALKGNLIAYGMYPKSVVAPVPTSCIQFKLAEDEQCHSFGPGQSMRNSFTCTRDLKFQNLDIQENTAELRMFNEKHNILAIQKYEYTPGNRWITINTTLTNQGKESVTLESLDSFSLNALSLFQPDGGNDCYSTLQWHSGWAGEGRLEMRNIEDCGLENSWSGYSYRGYRIGSRTSVPNHNSYPQFAIYDRKAKVIWGASLTAFGPWMMECSRNGDFLNLEGGMADREFIGWFRTLAPGESYSGPLAAVATCQVPENISPADAIGNCLAPYASTDPQYLTPWEKTNPALFNDWCKTWGVPTSQKLQPVLDILAKTNVAYLIMDFGWFYSASFGREEDARPEKGDIGDWNVRQDYYEPDFASWVEQIRAKGLRAGVWFELENVVQKSLIYKEHPDWLLTLDGRILTNGERAFLDFRKPEVQAYLDEKVIKFIKDNHIGFMKSDYNAAIGFGCDGRFASPAANMQEVVEGMVDFYRRLRREVPELTLENCSSGGFRLSPAWLQLSSVLSSSDTHEGVEIPLVAADVSRLIPGRNNELWCTLHDWDSEERQRYLLCGGMLARLCLSGDVDKLNDTQLSLVMAGLEHYDAIRHLLSESDTYIFRQLKSRSYLEPQGNQLVVRTDYGRKNLSAILHAFKNAEAVTEWELPGEWQFDRSFAADCVKFELKPSNGKTHLKVSGLTDFSAAAVLLKQL